jgi:hypothetical protein
MERRPSLLGLFPPPTPPTLAPTAMPTTAPTTCNDSPTSKCFDIVMSCTPQPGSYPNYYKMYGDYWNRNCYAEEINFAIVPAGHSHLEWYGYDNYNGFNIGCGEQTLHMRDSGEDGWDGATLSVFKDGKAIAGPFSTQDYGYDSGYGSGYETKTFTACTLPTLPPTPLPTHMPTAHPCDDGSHNCDTSSTQCTSSGNNGFTCVCLEGYVSPTPWAPVGLWPPTQQPTEYPAPVTCVATASPTIAPTPWACTPSSTSRCFEVLVAAYRYYRHPSVRCFSVLSLAIQQPLVPPVLIHCPPCTLLGSCRDSRQFRSVAPKS